MSIMEPVLSEYFKQNRMSWDDRVPVHMKSDFYNVRSFINGDNSLTEIEQKYLGNVFGKRILHMQCHFGLDTLSLSRLGAVCTGIDFSGEAINQARKLNEVCKLNAHFIESNVYQIKDCALGLFDLVFSSYGTICWLHDLQTWAAIIADSLKPGGEFYFADFHPGLYMFDFNTRQLAYSYFNTGQPYTELEMGSYADTNFPKEMISHFWSHSLDEVIENLLLNGLQLTLFKEFDFSPYNCFPGMKEISKNRFRFGSDDLRIPHVYLIKAVKIK